MTTDNLDYQSLKDMLIRHEGVKSTAYHDSLGYPTVGIGHLITTTDTIEVGDTISDGHLQRLFDNDLDSKIADCHKLYTNFPNFPQPVKEALINMMFNLGYTQMSCFHGFNDTVNREDWGVVADFLRNNFKRWYMQVGLRAVDVENMFRQAARGI